MSHQKTKRVQSPLKGMSFSMLIQNHQSIVRESRITQKRKPIFDDTPSKSQVSRSSSLRRKIFSQTEKSKEKSQDLRFSKLLQTEYLPQRQGEDLNDHQILESHSSDSIKSSNIEQDVSLNDVKRQLFPATPIKQVANEIQHLQNGREWIISSSKKCNKRLFEEAYSPPKSTFSISTNNVDKTIMRFCQNTPERRQKLIQEKENSSSDRTQFNLSQNVKKAPYKQDLNVNISPFPKSFTKGLQKDIAKQLRELHNTMLEKTKAYTRKDSHKIALLDENKKLKEQNQQLKRQCMKLTINSDSFEKNTLIQQRDQQRKKISNENLFMKVKAQKAKHMLKSLLQLSQAELSLGNSIINVEQTIKQVIRQLQF